MIPGDELVQGQLQHECEREEGGYYQEALVHHNLWYISCTKRCD